MRPHLLLATCVALASSACDLNGHELAYPGASIYEAPDQGFHFYYLAPPWRLEDTDTQANLVYLVVDNNAQSGAYDPKDVSHKLWVRRAPSSNLKAEAERLRDEATSKGRAVARDVAEVQARTGAKGWEVHTTWDPPTGRLYYRDTLFHDAFGAPIRFSMAAAYPSDSRDIDLLVLSFTLGPAPDLPTPPRKPDARPPDGQGGDLGAVTDGGLP